MNINIKWFYIILVPIILSLLSFILIDYFYQTFFPNNYCLKIFIAILSQRNNFNKRQTIRQTWIQTINDINLNNRLVKSHDNCPIELKARFIIGNKDCPIHPLLRTTPYSCSFNEIKIHENNYEINLFEFNSTERLLFPYKTFFRGFSFVIRQPIIVTKIGVHRNVLTEDKNITIVLLNGQKETLKSVEISLKSFNVNQVFYEAIEPIVLSKDFYGLLTIDTEIIDYKHHYNSNVTLNRNGFIDVLRSYYGFTDYESIGYNSEQFIGPTLAFKVSDPKAVEYLYSKSSKQIQNKWSNEIIKTEEQLSEEILLNDDIILIDSIDIYRNLAEKVLKSIESTVESYDLSHFLKTDDDCYLNVNNIIINLLQNRHLKKVWFGNFRRLWPTDRWGKWAENDYESPIYPPFACGSGYLLSADLVQWIASNLKHLHRFQGEDVSMGIWMSAINPLLFEDKRWVCSDSDFNSSQSFSFPQLSEKQIIKIHNFISKT